MLFCNIIYMIYMILINDYNLHGHFLQKGI